ncbi:MAG: TetR family transcriptional regulator [Alphaproteobacteria bacterium]|nr:TetR family transcriptional regulator [Alphaproteobacteria bacterium]
MSSHPLHQTAAALIAKRGHDFTMDELALAAGVSRATLYRQVGSREALLAALEAQGVVLPPSPPGVWDQALDAARTLARQGGLEALTMEGVAAEAGLGVATLYRRFGDRAGLLSALMERAGARAKARAMALDEDAEPQEALTGLVAGALAVLWEDGWLIQLGAAASGAQLAALQEARGRSMGTLEALSRWMARQMKRGWLRPADPEELAGALMGATLLHGMMGTSHTDEALARRLVTLFLDGARAR